MKHADDDRGNGLAQVCQHAHHGIGESETAVVVAQVRNWIAISGRSKDEWASLTVTKLVKMCGVLPLAGCGNTDADESADEAAETLL
jgi:hypothetical protein